MESSRSFSKGLVNISKPVSTVDVPIIMFVSLLTHKIRFGKKNLLACLPSRVTRLAGYGEPESGVKLMY